MSFPARKHRSRVFVAPRLTAIGTTRLLDAFQRDWMGAPLVSCSPILLCKCSDNVTGPNSPFISLRRGLIPPLKLIHFYQWSYCSTHSQISPAPNQRQSRHSTQTEQFIGGRTPFVISRHVNKSQRRASKKMNKKRFKVTLN